MATPTDLLITLLDAVDTSVLLLDGEGSITRYNTAFQQLWPGSADTVIGQAAWNVLASDDDRLRVREQLRDPGQDALAWEGPLQTSDGAQRSLAWSCTRLRIDLGVEGAMLCTGIDVTQAERAREVLEQREHDLGERIKELNCLYAISGLVERQELSLRDILRGIVELIPPAWQYPEVTKARIRLEGQSVQTDNFEETPWRQACDIMIGGEPLGRLEVCYLEDRPESDEGPFLKEERHLLLGIANRIEQIVQLKRTSEALKESEEVHRLTLSNISDAVFITDDHGDFTYVCPNVHILFGYTQAEVEAMGNITHLLGEGIYRSEDLAQAKELPNIDHRAPDKAGRMHDLLVNVKRVSIKAGTILYTCRDVTELKEAQEQARRRQAELAHVSRLSTIGEMTSGLAHELNQPLSAVLNYANGCVRRLESGGEDREQLIEALHRVSAEAQRAGEIMRRLRDFARKGESQLERTSIDDVVREAAALLEIDARAHHSSIRLRLAGDLPAVDADVIQIEQVIVNLVRNGLEAMEETDPDERVLTIQTELAESDAVEIAVLDEGHGMSPDVERQAFNPFFTTKKDGMGIGLSLSRSIVESHGGKLWATPRPKRGMTFRFTLPTVSTAPHSGREESAGPA